MKLQQLLTPTSFQWSSNLFLNMLTEVDEMTLLGSLFQVLTTLWLKKFWRTWRVDRCLDSFKLWPLRWLNSENLKNCSLLIFSLSVSILNTSIKSPQSLLFSSVCFTINQSINQSINHAAGDKIYVSWKETICRRGHRLWLGWEWKLVEIRFRLHLKPDKSMLLKLPVRSTGRECQMVEAAECATAENIPGRASWSTQWSLERRWRDEIQNWSRSDR